MRAVYISVILLSLAIHSGLVAADPIRGEQLFHQWCTSCHLSENQTGSTGSDAAPPLREMVRGADKDVGYFRARIVDPHPPMPDFGLTADAIEDLAGYLASLVKP